MEAALKRTFSVTTVFNTRRNANRSSAAAEEEEVSVLLGLRTKKTVKKQNKLGDITREEIES